MKRGPKPELTASQLDLRRLPRAGSARVIAFIERFVRLPKGKGARQPLRLRPWQKDILAGLFDSPRPRQALRQLPRGNGKTRSRRCDRAVWLARRWGRGCAGALRGQRSAAGGDGFDLARRMVELEPLG